MPQVYMATSEMLVQEYIDGFTIAELQDNYEELTGKGILTVDEIDRVWDVMDDLVKLYDKKVRQVIDPIKHIYWAPDFMAYDINFGNIMILKSGFHDPKNNSVLIDPFR